MKLVWTLYFLQTLTVVRYLACLESACLELACPRDFGSNIAGGS